MTTSLPSFDKEDLISPSLIADRDKVKKVLLAALNNPDQFISLALKDKTIIASLSFSQLIKWLNKASRQIYIKTGRYLWTHTQAKNKFYLTFPKKDRSHSLDLKKIAFYRLQDIQDALQLVAEVERRSPDLQGKIVTSTSSFPSSPTSKTSLFKRTLSINGVPALEFDLKKHHNLNEPLVDVSLKVNNPLGRLWLAIKRLFKKQKTVIALKFSIPLLVLPLLFYLLFHFWQGRGVHPPVAKLGIIHQVTNQSHDQDILILPTADVYLLNYSNALPASKHILNQPVIVIGTLNPLTNTIIATNLIPYDPNLRFPNDTSSPSLSPSSFRQFWDNSWNFFQYFK